MTTEGKMTVVMTDTDWAKLELWLRMAKAVIRAYSKLPMTKHNTDLNKELSDLALLIREIDPSLKSYHPLD